MSVAWDPTTYRQFAAERDRPGLDLLARLSASLTQDPRLIVDLGCGTGELTAKLKSRWPNAQVMGLDQSAAMLEKARTNGADINWQQGDITAWRPTTLPDVIFSNAALQWVEDHQTLFPQLLGLLAPGGTLAVQMPRNFDAPAHQTLYALAREVPWRDRLRDVLREEPVAPPDRYVTWLLGSSVALQLWETEYYQFLTGSNPVLEWMKGTALRPVLTALTPDEQTIFLKALQDRLAQAYPPLANGQTLFPFRRLFLLAQIR